MGIAALVSTTPMYQEAYGSLDSDDNGNSYDGASDHDYCPPSGDEDSEDEDNNFGDIDLTLEDERRSSFPKPRIINLLVIISWVVLRRPTQLE